MSLRLRWPISLPSKRISPEVGSYSRVISRPVVVLPQPDSPTRPSDSPLPSKNEMPSTAWTCATVRRTTPPDFTGKYFTRSRTSSRGSPAGAPDLSGARSTSALVTVLILPSNVVRVDCGQLRNEVTGAGVDQIRSDLRQDLLGVDLARVRQVTTLDVVLTA